MTITLSVTAHQLDALTRSLGAGRFPGVSAAQLVNDAGALALKVYVHPMAEGLARAGAHRHLDQVIGL